MQAFREVIGEIVRGEQSGQTFVRQQEPHNLRWTWKNTSNQKKIVLRLYDVKQAMNEIGCEIGRQIILDFIYNSSTALQTKQAFERLERLSAFL